MAKYIFLSFLVIMTIKVSLQYPASLFEDEDDVESRIYGGTFAKQGELPWMVFLLISKGNDEFGICGGFIISKRHVMTAAHCVCSDAKTKAYDNVKDITGLIGHINIEDATPVKFKKLIVHDGYDEELNADIALIEFESPLTKFDDNIRNICLPKKGKRYPDRQPVLQMGWGRFDNRSSGISLRLKITDAGYILNNPSCIKEMWSYAEPGQLCISNTKGEKVCAGDSGGPLVLADGEDKMAIGIVSFDYYEWCVEGNGRPAIYTDISYYANWVKTNTNDNGICWRD